MLRWWTRRRRRRRLSPIVVELPRLLASRFGGKDAYTVQQVARALDILRIGPEDEPMPYAYAVACEASQFTAAIAGAPQERRRELLLDLARLFELDEADLALRKLRRARLKTAFQTANPNDHEQYGGPGGHPHAGDGSP